MPATSPATSSHATDAQLAPHITAKPIATPSPRIPIPLSSSANPPPSTAAHPVNRAISTDITTTLDTTHTTHNPTSTAHNPYTPAALPAYTPAAQSVLFAQRVNAIAGAIRSAAHAHTHLPARSFLAGLASSSGLAAVSASDVVRLIEERVERRVLRQLRAQARSEAAQTGVAAAVDEICVSGAPLSLLLAERERALRVAELAAEDVLWVSGALADSLADSLAESVADSVAEARREAVDVGAGVVATDAKTPPHTPVVSPVRAPRATVQLRVTPSRTVALTPRLTRRGLHRTVSLELFSPDTDAARGEAGIMAVAGADAVAVAAALDAHVALVHREAATVAAALSRCPSAEAVLAALSQDAGEDMGHSSAQATHVGVSDEAMVTAGAEAGAASDPRRALLAELHAAAADDRAEATMQSDITVPLDGADATAAAPPEHLYLEELFSLECVPTRAGDIDAPPPLLWVSGVSGTPGGRTHQQLRERGAPTPPPALLPPSSPAVSLSASASAAELSALHAEPRGSAGGPPVPAPVAISVDDDSVGASTGAPRNVKKGSTWLADLQPVDDADAASADTAVPAVRVISHPRVIHGFTVHFPADRPPYPTQLAYCARLLSALSARGNALLESPTGTGKSVCMLAGAVAFLVRERPLWERTHGQQRAAQSREQALTAEESDEEFALRGRERGTFDTAGARRAEVARKRRAEWSSKAQHAQRRALPRPAETAAAAHERETKRRRSGDAACSVALPAGAPSLTDEQVAVAAAGNAESEAAAQLRAVAQWGRRWRKTEEEFPPPRVIVASRTHTQLAQLAETLRGLPRPPMIVATTLASRKVMCTHPMAPSNAEDEVRSTWS